MKHVSDFAEDTSPYELFEFLYNKVMSREITSFSALLNAVQGLPNTRVHQAVYRKVFALIRELNWGVFSRLDPERYPALWKQLVLSQPGFPGVGDLKRNTSISTLYTAILDIHGYSAFCQKHRRNLSMIELLDECIHNDILHISQSHQTLSWRSEGDALVLIAASARHICTAVLNIIDYFSRRRVLKSKEIIESKVLNKIALPEMTVSAGIAGGRNFTPLVITHDGNVSGDIVNTAARLQMFANILDPTETRVLVTNHVAHHLKKVRPAQEQSALDSVEYFFLGRFQFKGMDLTVFDLLYLETQKQKLRYQKSIVHLFNALRKDMWREQVFSALTDCLRDVVQHAPKATIAGIPKIDVLEKCSIAKLSYNSGTDYRKAVALLDEVCALLPEMPHADGVIALYADKVMAVYRELADRFYLEMEKSFEDALNKYLDLEQRDRYLKTARSKELHDKMKSKGIQALMNGNQKHAWHRILDQAPELLTRHMYIGKK